jgi:hypothetical protein
LALAIRRPRRPRGLPSIRASCLWFLEGPSGPYPLKRIRGPRRGSFLGWRDQLVEAGWSPHKLKSGPPRLRDLAAAELAGCPLIAGMFDRLAEVLDALVESPRLPLKRVSLSSRPGLSPSGRAEPLEGCVFRRGGDFMCAKVRTKTGD